MKSSMTRRDLLQSTLRGAAAGASCMMGERFFSQELLAASNAGGGSGPIVVVLQLNGGNDALNTVIPYGSADSSIYYGARPTLSIAQAEVLPLDSEYGLHPKLTQLKGLWDLNQLAIINGVGYPNPNLSHFTSFDYWHTAEPNEQVRDGWLGRFFEHQCANSAISLDPTIGLNVGLTETLAFRTKEKSLGVTLKDPAAHRWYGSGLAGEKGDEQALYTELINAPVGGITSKPGLAFVEERARNTMGSLELLGVAVDAQNAPGAAFPTAAFPDTGLGRDLKNIAGMIYADVGTCVYHVEQLGYDTHGSQAELDGDGKPLEGRHAALLEELDGALGAFVSEMKAQGNWDRMLLFTVSEFGRKVIENGSLGTDHGAASSLFVTGGHVQAGFYGQMPSLAETNRIKNHSLAFNVDFRRVYRTVLQEWLGVPEAAISTVLPTAPTSGGFATLPFIST